MEQPKIKVGINGFGRIGRLVLRAALQTADLELRAINDPFMDIDQIIYLLKHDTVHGPFPYQLQKQSSTVLLIQNRQIQLLSHKQTIDIDWKQHDVEYVVESSGQNLTTVQNQGHLDNGAQKVIISAPAKDQTTKTIILGVNQDQYNSSEHQIVSNGSCTTNCLAPLVNLLEKELGIEQAIFTTVHSVTSTQQTVDSFSKAGKDKRAGRSVLNNIIPSSTGASSTIFKVLPQLQGKIAGNCYRVPTLDVSLIDLNVKVKQSCSLDQIYELVRKYSDIDPDIIGINEGDEVSQDYRGDVRSCIVDSGAGIAVDDRLFKIVAWYDNEWAYSKRVVQLIQFMFSKDSSKQ